MKFAVLLVVALALAIASAAPLSFKALNPPQRLFDTRNSGKVPAGGTFVGTLQYGGAKAFVGAVLSINADGAGFATVWGTGAWPQTSSINYPGGNVVSASFYSSLAPNGAFNLYTNVGSDFIVDAVGVFVESSDGAWYTPIPAARVLDTRSSGGAISGTRAVSLAQAGIPSSAVAVSYSAGLIAQAAAGYFSVWAEGGADGSGVSPGYFNPGVITQTSGVTPVSATGNAVLFANQPAHVIVDVDGYFSASGSSGFVPLVSPRRLVDTRNSVSLGGGFVVDFDFTMGGVPTGSAAAVVTITVISSAAGFVTTYPRGASQRPTAVAQFNPSQPVGSVAAIVQLSTAGLASFVASARGDVIIDVVGYMSAPGPTPTNPETTIPDELRIPPIIRPKKTNSPAPTIETTDKPTEKPTEKPKDSTDPACNAPVDPEDLKKIPPIIREKPKHCFTDAPAAPLPPLDPPTKPTEKPTEKPAPSMDPACNAPADPEDLKKIPPIIREKPKSCFAAQSAALTSQQQQQVDNGWDEAADELQ